MESHVHVESHVRVESKLQPEPEGARRSHDVLMTWE